MIDATIRYANAIWQAKGNKAWINHRDVVLGGLRTNSRWSNVQYVLTLRHTLNGTRMIHHERFSPDRDRLNIGPWGRRGYPYPKGLMRGSEEWWDWVAETVLRSAVHELEQRYEGMMRRRHG